MDPEHHCMFLLRVPGMQGTDCSLPGLLPRAVSAVINLKGRGSISLPKAGFLPLPIKGMNPPITV